MSKLNLNKKLKGQDLISDIIGKPDLNNNEKDIKQVKTYLLIPFKNHPFKLYEGNKLNDMVESIKEYGILSPVIAREIENREELELLSGHNRVNAAKIIGLETVPTIIKNVDDDTAQIIVAEANFMQRQDFLPSERAKAYAARKRFVSRIATGNYDAIIIGHSQYEKISISKERQQRMINEQIDQVVESISEIKSENGEQWAIKQMEKTKLRLEESLKKLVDTVKDDVINFEELGIDCLFVDEAHNYKNCAIFSKMRNVAGISNTMAKKSTDMLMKCQYIQEINNGRNVIFATGTPISNSMVELYVMMRYLEEKELHKMGIYHFDSWASNFGEVVSSLELAPEGTGYRFRNRFAKFVNLPELMTMFKNIADIQTPDMINLPVPKLKDDKYKIIMKKQKKLCLNLQAEQKLLEMVMLSLGKIICSKL